MQLIAELKKAEGENQKSEQRCWDRNAQFYYDFQAFCPQIIFKHLHDFKYDNHKRIEAEDGHVKDEVEEKFQVPLPNTVRQPLTVVVHPKHTTPTSTAVMRSYGFDALALPLAPVVILFAHVVQLFLRERNLCACCILVGTVSWYDKFQISESVLRRFPTYHKCF